MRGGITITAKTSTTHAQKTPAPWMFGLNQFASCKIMEFRESTGELSGQINLLDVHFQDYSFIENACIQSSLDSKIEF